ncbi:MAG TPA: radical SAM protein [Phycisphaerae bacterium]|nr:radical SAM protein [Phycisphaerae bacterium]
MSRPDFTSRPAGPGRSEAYVPRLIAWEITRACPLSCAHCRAGGRPPDDAEELSTDECRRLADNIASVGKPIIILTGGEPLTRADVFDIAAYAHSLGLPVVMGTCGTLLDDQAARRLAEAGVRRISVSIDGATNESHDAIRGAEGAFEAALHGIEAARRAGLDFQINTTVSRTNRDELPEIMQLAARLGASVFNPFLLVPTGRGREMIDRQLSAEQYEQTLQWLVEQGSRDEIRIRVTCAPHYQRIIRQAGGRPDARSAGGCLGGKSFAFISHTGKVQICGFLDIECGDVRQAGYDFARIWRDSEVFRRVRDVDAYRGRCGVCEFRNVCGGCRARAYAMTGDYLGAEPLCLHRPAPAPPPQQGQPPEPLDETDRRILTAIQVGFPVVRWPYEVLAARLEMPSDQIEGRAGGLIERGLIRRIGGVFDARRLGYVSTLVAARIPEDRLDDVAIRVNRISGVTHNYLRDHSYNLWFTLTCASQSELEAAIEALREQTGIEEFHSLPALAAYKSAVVFSLDGSPPPPARRPGQTAEALELDESQRKLVRLVQGTLPAGPNPLSELARRWGRPVEILIVHLRHWLTTGLMRRFGAVLAHRRIGFTANGLAVFNVPAERVDAAGEAMAQHAEVSHCYRRTTLDDWPYSLLAVVHGHSVEQVRQFVERVAAELDLPDHDVLFSTREYKKTSMQFFMEAN